MDTSIYIYIYIYIYLFIYACMRVRMGVFEPRSLFDQILNSWINDSLVESYKYKNELYEEDVI